MCTLSLSTLFYSFENHYVWLKQFAILRDMGLEQERALQQFFHFFWSKLSFILFLYCLWFSFTYDVEETFVVFRFHVQWHKINSIWWTNEKNIEKCLMIGTCLMMGNSTLVSIKKNFFKDFSSCIAHLDSNKLACAIFYENCWTYVVVVIVIW
jgi:hypothetical protein